jgi:hypothetical protein
MQTIDAKLKSGIYGFGRGSAFTPNGTGAENGPNP